MTEPHATASIRPETGTEVSDASVPAAFDDLGIAVIGLGADDTILCCNRTARELWGIAATPVALADCPIQWEWGPVRDLITEGRHSRERRRLTHHTLTRSDGGESFLRLTVIPPAAPDDGGVDLLLIGEDFSEFRRMEQQLAQAQRLESIGQLAAGIAHEINTPMQYVGDNTLFLDESFGDLRGVLEQLGELVDRSGDGAITAADLEPLRAAMEAADTEYLLEEIPRAIQQSLEGIGRVTKIVRAMKAFTHPGQTEKEALDINRAIETTITVARNAWKYHCELETEFDENLPPVPCLTGEFNQTVLNILVNAAHAIEDRVRDSGGKGRITIRTRQEDDWARISLSDTGGGIPEAIRERIFDPFFTTKEVGRGTGQGLSIVHNAIVVKHGGRIDLESEPGVGTTFHLLLPLYPEETPAEA